MRGCLSIYQSVCPWADVNFQQPVKYTVDIKVSKLLADLACLYKIDLNIQTQKD